MSMNGPRQDVQKMSVQEVANVREQTQDFEAVLKNVDGREGGLQDRGALVRKVNRNNFILQRDEALRAKGRSKDTVAKEIKQIEEAISKERPTRRMMETKPGTPEFSKAVQANLAFQKKFGKLMFRLKDLKRRLAPDDPNASNLEMIRPN